MLDDLQVDESVVLKTTMKITLRRIFMLIKSFWEHSVSSSVQKIEFATFVRETPSIYTDEEDKSDHWSPRCLHPLVQEELLALGHLPNLLGCGAHFDFWTFDI